MQFILARSTQTQRVSSASAPSRGLQRCRGCRTGTSFRSRSFPFLRRPGCFWRAEPLRHACPPHRWPLRRGCTVASLGKNGEGGGMLTLQQTSDIWRPSLGQRLEKTRATLSDYGWTLQHINSIDDGRKEHLRDFSFVRGKKYLPFKFLQGLLRVAQCAPGPYSLKMRLKIYLRFTQISTVKSRSSILPTSNRRRIPKPNSCRDEWKGTSNKSRTVVWLLASSLEKPEGKRKEEALPLVNYECC